MLHREPGPYAGEEWRCVQCGHVDYGELVLRQSQEAVARREAGGRMSQGPRRRLLA